MSSFGQVEELQKSRQVPHLSGAIRRQTYKVKIHGDINVRNAEGQKWAEICNLYMFDFKCMDPVTSHI